MKGQMPWVLVSSDHGTVMSSLIWYPLTVILKVQFYRLSCALYGSWDNFFEIKPFTYIYIYIYIYVYIFVEGSSLP